MLRKRLSYVAVEKDWSAACVYRDPGGALHGFASTNERKNGVATVYKFVCEDKDVTYYISDDREKGGFREKGEPFEAKAKVYNEDYTVEKKSMIDWGEMISLT